jgi:hypothetical protein
MSICFCCFVRRIKNEIKPIIAITPAPASLSFISLYEYKGDIQMRNPFYKLESYLQDIALENKIKNHINRYHYSYRITRYIRVSHLNITLISHKLF